MAYYQDPDYRDEAERAVLALGDYFTSLGTLQEALDLGRGQPNRWFSGGVPSPGALKRVRDFLRLAALVEPLAKGDKKAVGRFFEAAGFKGRVFFDPDGEQEVVERARRHFRHGVLPAQPRSQWRKTLRERHRIAAGPTKDEAEHEPEALAALLGDLR